MFILKQLPPDFDTNNVALLKQIVTTSRELAELKGAINSIPNENILLDTLIFNEAQASNAIENIITTFDELYRSNVEDEDKMSLATKEAKNYAEAVKFGYELIKKNGLLTTNDIINIQKVNAPNYAEIRKIPGTFLKNEQTKEIVYTPPQDYNQILDLLNNLEKYINDPSFSDVDPLIKMAVIHYQFESIHPFHDGNGRMGRILNILYLTQQNLLKPPILYLSRYIIENKSSYYRLLQAVRDNDDWLEWCLWLIKGVEVIGKDTIKKVEAIKKLVQDYKQRIRKNHSFYSQDLINTLFRHPYTKIEFITKELKISRPTATKYLDSLTKDGFLEKVKLGRDNFYFNSPLIDVLK